MDKNVMNQKQSLLTGVFKRLSIAVLILALLQMHIPLHHAFAYEQTGGNINEEIPLADPNLIPYDFSEYNIIDESQRYFNPARYEAIRERMSESVHLTALDALTNTQGAPMGVFGFDGEFDDPLEMVEIIVQFTTPPSVALDLMEAHDTSSSRTSADASNETIAQAAHLAFDNALNQIIMPLSAQGPEIISRHYRLFNGYYMIVPASMINSIAALPMVFSVQPNYEMHILSEQVEISDVFMRETIELFDTDYIHNGATRFSISV